MKRIIFTFDPEEFKNDLVSEVVKNLSLTRNNPNQGSRLLTRKETAEYLRIALSTLWKLTKLGQIEAVYIGNRVFYKEEAVEKALQSLNIK
ncbi:helix-turn-helix domain-containing protein [Gaetbulibacter sp. M235]|uniref:helix-turn-helix transcriptional regulator n=1 Tax=Gaetbulibacter sp. M235 TaxID=3126510 RepID=UPI00374F0446